jgi:nitroimidazol reductase NimA-like FMN-containing flavoprotein (pyridoxamine 5'-phosphate oxidase superfamily)
MTEAWLEPLPLDECIALLREQEVGRIALNLDDVPAIFPINYRLVEAGGRHLIALRTRPGNVIDRAPTTVAFEIDFADTAHHDGWSVLVRGTLHEINDAVPWVHDKFDSAPWLDAERDAWLVVEPNEITGRRLHPAGRGWAFDIRAYL